MDFEPVFLNDGYDDAFNADNKKFLFSQVIEYCNIRLLQSHMRLKKNRPYNYWLRSQGHYLLCFSASNQSEPIRFACDMRLRPVTA